FRLRQKYGERWEFWTAGVMGAPKAVQADDHASSACPVSLIQRAYRRRCALYAPVTRGSRRRGSGGRGAGREKNERELLESREASAGDQNRVKTSSDEEFAARHFCTLSSRRVGITGLPSVWQTVGKSLRISSTLRPVTTITRSSDSGSSSRRKSITCVPLSLGRTISRRMTLYLPAESLAMASSPSVASSTSQPELVRSWRSRLRVTASSSTMSARGRISINDEQIIRHNYVSRITNPAVSSIPCVSCAPF